MFINSIISLLVCLIFVIGIPVLIGVYVYRDATQRGMNAALWTLVAVLAPTLIGFIIYLLVRGSYSDLECPSCAAAVTDQYMICPKCGAKLKASCSSCGFPIEAGWTACPKCASSLPENHADYTAPARKKDTALGKILIIVILAPVLLLLLIAILGFGSFSGGSSMRTVYVSEEDCKANPEVAAWISQCDENPSKAYALCYQVAYGEQKKEKETHYLIYMPSMNNVTSMQSGTHSGLFGTSIEMKFYESAYPDVGEKQLPCISNYSDKFPGLKLFINDKQVDCEITKADYNLALLLPPEDRQSLYWPN